MAVLHNRVSQKELKERLFLENEPRITLSFYRYSSIDNPKMLRDELYKNLDALRVFGRIYLAHEGINAQVSLPEKSFDSFKQYLYSISFLNDVRLNIAVDNDGKSFWVLKIKVRDKIVADGISDPSFSMHRKGRYVDASSFNKLTEDRRNNYRGYAKPL